MTFIHIRLAKKLTRTIGAIFLSLALFGFQALPLGAENPKKGPRGQFSGKSAEDIKSLLKSSRFNPNNGIIKDKATMQPAYGRNYKPGQLIIRYKSDPTTSSQLNSGIETRFESINRKHRHHRVKGQSMAYRAQGSKTKRVRNLDKEDNKYLSNTYLVEVDPSVNLQSVVNDYKNDPNVEFVEPNALVHLDANPNDVEYPNQWGPSRIQAKAAWDVTTGNSNVIVAVIDSGVDLSHPDLQANLWKNSGEVPGNGLDDDGNGYMDDYDGYNALTPGGSVADGSGHGTHVAGIIGAIGNNGVGVTGLSWRCRIMPIKAVDDNNNDGTAQQIADAIVYAVNNGARIINLSLGSEVDSFVLKSAVDFAAAAGVLVVASAGNEDKDIPHYPAAYVNAVGVASVGPNDIRTRHSNFADWVDMTAPGENILSTMPTYHVSMNDGPWNIATTYGYMSGTSMAAPHVAGVAALLAARFPSDSLTQMRDRLINTAFNIDPINPDYAGKLGRGRINAAYAVGAPSNLLTVNNGFGTGYYAPDVFAPVMANASPTGQVFNSWAGATVSNPNFSLTSLMMPTGSANVTATYKNIQPGQGKITTVAGDGELGYWKDGVSATQAILYNPQGVAVDKNGNLYIADTNNARIRRVDRATGLISTIAGTGVPGFSGDGGPAILAQINVPFSLDLDNDGNLYFTDQGNNRIRKIEQASGIITTLASGIAFPLGLSVDSGKNVYVAGNLFSIMKIEAITNAVSVFASDYWFPLSVKKASNGDVFVTDLRSGLTRIDNVTGTRSSIAIFGNITYGLVMDKNGMLFVSEESPGKIWRVDPQTGVKTRVAGSGVSGFSGDSMLAEDSLLAKPAGIAIDEEGNLFVADSGNSRIRKISFSKFPPVLASVSPARGTQSGGYNVTLYGSGFDAGATVKVAGKVIYQTTRVNDTQISVLMPNCPNYGFETAIDIEVINPDGKSSRLPYAFTYIGPPGVFTVLPTSGRMDTATPIKLTGSNFMNGAKVQVGGVDASQVVFVDDKHLTANVPIGSAGSKTVTVLNPDGLSKSIRNGFTVVAPPTLFSVTPNIGPMTGNYPVYLNGTNFTPGLTVKMNNTVCGITSFIDSTKIMAVVPSSPNMGITTSVGFSVIDGLGQSGSVSNAFTYMAPPWVTSVSPNSGSTEGGATIAIVGGNFAVGSVVKIGGVIATNVEYTHPTTMHVNVPAGTAGAKDIVVIGPDGQQGTKTAAFTYVAPPNYITTVAGTGVAGFFGDGLSAFSAKLNGPGGIAVDSSGNLFIMDSANYRVRRVDRLSGVITTVAGNGANSGPLGDGGLAINSRLLAPISLTLDPNGNIFIADFFNRVRRVDRISGVISTLAGNGTAGFSGDGGLVANAKLNWPQGVASDRNGNIYIADYGNARVRRVDALTGIITTVAGNGDSNYSGDGGLAISAGLSVHSVVVDSLGNLFIADDANNRIRRIDHVTGIITTVGGNGIAGYSGDGGPATAAKINFPTGISVDADNNIYFVSGSGGLASPDARLRRIDHATGIITTLAGNGTNGYAGDGGLAVNGILNQPNGVAIDSLGTVYIADTYNNRIRRVGPNEPEIVALQPMEMVMPAPVEQVDSAPSVSDPDPTIAVNKPLYGATVNGGMGSGNYLEKEIVTITANMPATGMIFKGWEGDVMFKDKMAPTTTFEMPARSLTITAKFSGDTVSKPTTGSPLSDSTSKPSRAKFGHFANSTKGPMTIAVETTETETVDIKVYDTHGQLIRSLYQGPLGNSSTPMKWDGLDDSGNKVASGIYLLVMTKSDGSRETKKIAIVR